MRDHASCRAGPLPLRQPPPPPPPPPSAPLQARARHAPLTPSGLAAPHPPTPTPPKLNPTTPHPTPHPLSARAPTTPSCTPTRRCSPAAAWRPSCSAAAAAWTTASRGALRVPAVCVRVCVCLCLCVRAHVCVPAVYVTGRSACVCASGASQGRRQCRPGRLLAPAPAPPAPQPLLLHPSLHASAAAVSNTARAWPSHARVPACLPAGPRSHGKRRMALCT